MAVVNRTSSGFRIKGENYTLSYDRGNKYYISLMFKNGIGAQLFIPSACDQEKDIDRCIDITGYSIKNAGGVIKAVFSGKSTVWSRAEYVFECRQDTVIYAYTVFGKGNIERGRFFEGYLKNDPKLDEYGYPYFCGPWRKKSYHRQLKEFTCSSKPDFDLLFAPSLNSSDTRYMMYYENTMLRVTGSRTFLGGDWLVTPPPFCYLMGRRDKQNWVSMGLAVKPGENNFMAFQYLGGEGFGLNLDYMGYTKVSGKWESPAIVFQASTDEYDGLRQYVDFLHDEGYIAKTERHKAKWWKKPIFCPWGEQMWLSDRWPSYLRGDPKVDIGSLNTQKLYTSVLKKIERYGINPGTLIIDNRWFKVEDEFEPDPKLWPDMKGFIAEQHAKGRKIILWSSPCGHAQNALGRTIPLDECMTAQAKANKEAAAMNIDISYPYEMVAGIDTDIFYPYTHKGKKPDPVKKDVKYNPIFIDPTNPKYEKRLRARIRFLISPEGLDADGFKFDYTHFLPMVKGVRMHRTMWGVEILKKLLWIYSDESKRIKKDALMITHTYNPYFSDIVGMCRLQDLYTDKKSVVKQMAHRAKIARIACPGCEIDTDNHPLVSLAAWSEYAKEQPNIGVPALYYVSGVEITHEPLKPGHFRMIKKIWDEYTKRLG